MAKKNSGEKNHSQESGRQKNSHQKGR